LEFFSGIVAIDDLHVADADPDVARFVTSLIELSKTGISWIIASRSTSGLPVGSWLAYRDADLPIDENDLRFTFDEAASAAVELGLPIGGNEIRDLLEITEGWPAAMNFALRTSTRSSDLRNISAVTREMAYRFLAEQVYGAFNDEERELLEVAIALPAIDVEVLERAGFDRALQIVESLRERTAFIHEESPGVYHCHDLFREFLRHQGALAGKRSQQQVHERAARALEADGDVEHAIAGYVAACARADVLRLLELHGFDLLERARSDVVSRALEVLDERTRQENAFVLALSGLVQASSGRFARAEALFVRALARAENEPVLIARVSLRLAAMLGNAGRDVSPILSPISNGEGFGPDFRAEALSLIAARKAVAGDLTCAEALPQIETLLPHVESEFTRAKILHHVGIVRRHVGAIDKAFENLHQASDLARSLHLYGVASRVNAVLSNLVLHENDDANMQLRYAEASASDAVRAGDAFGLRTALIQMLSASIRNGDDSSIRSIEGRFSTLSLDEAGRNLVSFFRAVRLSWEGRFKEAHFLMSSCWGKLYFDFDRAAAGAQNALFLAIDDEQERSTRICAAVRPLLQGLKVTGLFRSRSVAISKAYLALAESANDRMTLARHALRQMRSDEQVESAVRRAVEAMIPDHYHASSDGSLADNLVHLEALGYIDAARLLRAVHAVLRKKREGEKPSCGLTSSEVKVLKMLSEGLVAKEIAADTARSLNTVRAHIANASLKLECRGQAEAIRKAHRLGIL